LLNLPPSVGRHTPNGGFKAPASKAGSVIGGQGKSFGGHIPGFEQSGKPTSRAPTVVGGSKRAAKPLTSVVGGEANMAGSTIQRGGPRFF
jgi:hypothetical protein